MINFRVLTHILTQRETNLVEQNSDIQVGIKENTQIFFNISMTFYDSFFFLIFAAICCHLVEEHLIVLHVAVINQDKILAVNKCHHIYKKNFLQSFSDASLTVCRASWAASCNPYSFPLTRKTPADQMPQSSWIQDSFTCTFPLGRGLALQSGMCLTTGERSCPQHLFSEELTELVSLWKSSSPASTVAQFLSTLTDEPLGRYGP